MLVLVEKTQEFSTPREQSSSVGLVKHVDPVDPVDPVVSVDLVDPVDLVHVDPVDPVSPLDERGNEKTQAMPLRTHQGNLPFELRNQLEEESTGDRFQQQKSVDRGGSKGSKKPSRAHVLRVRAEKKQRKREHRKRGKLWREVREKALRDILQSKSSISSLTQRHAKNTYVPIISADESKSSISSSTHALRAHDERHATYVPIISTNHDLDADESLLSMSFDVTSSSSSSSGDSDSSSFSSDYSDSSSSSSDASSRKRKKKKKKSVRKKKSKKESKPDETSESTIFAFQQRPEVDGHGRETKAALQSRFESASKIFANVTPSKQKVLGTPSNQKLLGFSESDTSSDSDSDSSTDSTSSSHDSRRKKKRKKRKKKPTKKKRKSSSKPVAIYFECKYATRLNRLRKQLYRKGESVYDWILRIRQLKDREGGWSWTKYFLILTRCYQGNRSSVTNDPYSGYDWALRLEKSQPEVLRDPDAAELAMILYFDYFGVRRWVREFTLRQQPDGISCEDWIYSLKRTAERAIVWAPGIISDLGQVATIAFDGFTNMFARKQRVSALKLRSRYRPVTITWEMVEKIAFRADLVTAENSRLR